jgi:hypothetical protein
VGAIAIASYRPRDPASSDVHQVLGEHLATFRSWLEEAGTPLPGYVDRELQRAFECGSTALGFARVRCTSCEADIAVAFSCKGRGFCPSCTGRRMADTAAWLVDAVLPEVPVRQWVLSLPYRLSYLCARDPELCSAVRRILVNAVFGSLRKRCGITGKDARSRAFPGAVVFVQRFDGALRLNLHFHAMFLDGVYRPKDETCEAVAFLPAPQLRDKDVARVVRAIRQQVALLLRRRSIDLDEPIDPSECEDPALAICHAAAVQGRLAFGPDAGRWARRVGCDPTALAPHTANDRMAPSIPKKLCANDGGYSLHARVRVSACARRRLEQLCRYAARGPIAQGRLSRTSDGQILYRFKRPFRDGTTHVLLSQQEFLERLAAQVPPPRRHMVTYHGVLAPASGYRDQVVPEDRPYREPMHRHRKAKPKPKDDGERPATGEAHEEGDAEQPSKPKRRSTPWAELLMRTFGLDPLHCPLCGGRRELIALITQPHTAQRILAAMHLPADPPVLAPARPPPQPRLPFAE